MFFFIVKLYKRLFQQTGSLHTAHADHTIGNPTPQIICLCPTCHERYDYRKREHQIALERMKHQKILVTIWC